MNGQQLKNSILQMAVQGKLVPQDPNDESASVLIQRIREEKEKLIKEKKIKKEKNPSYIFRGSDNLHYEKTGDNEPVCIEDQIPFEIPSSWQWTRLGDLFYLIMGQSPKGESVTEYGRGIEFHQGKMHFDKKYIKHSTLVTSEPSKIAPANSVLLCVRAPVGKVNITKHEICIGRGLCSIIPLGNMLSDFVYYFLLNYESILTKQATGTTFIAVTGEVVKNQLFPVPPIQEQIRIVAKIEELIPHIDEYDAKESKINELNSTFPEQLKKSILQDAVQGKLVPQDPSDEPASTLLERIREEKARLVKEGKIKKDKNESVIFRRDNSYYEKSNGVERCINEEIPFEIPDAWEWTRVKNVASVLGGKRIPVGKSLTTENTGHVYIRVADMKNNSVSTDRLLYVPNDVYPSISRYIINKEDLYITVAGTIGSVGKIPSELNGSNLTENADRLVFTCIDQAWFMWCLLSGLVQNQIIDATTKVGQPKLAIKRIENLLIALPPLAEQQRIVTKIEQLLAMIKSL